MSDMSFLTRIMSNIDVHRGLALVPTHNDICYATSGKILQWKPTVSKAEGVGGGGAIKS